MKKLFLLSFILMLSFGNAQKEKEFFFPLDTIILNKPIIFSLKNYEGYFVTELSNFNKRDFKKKSKVLASENIYFMGFNPYIFSIRDDFRYNTNKCEIKVNENLYYDSFTEDTVSFAVGLIKASYYDKLIRTVDKEKTVLHKTNNKVYYKIIFPICSTQ